MVRNVESKGDTFMDNASTDKSDNSVARGFVNGVKAGMPIAIGYLPGAVACGILAGSAGLAMIEGFFMSLIVFAGASQFAALNLLMIGASFPEIVLATAVLNARLVMLSSSISRRLLPERSVLKRAWIGFELTDESFSVAAARKERFFASEFLMGLNLPGHFVWVSGTLLGYLGASILSPGVQKSMGIAIYALLIGLLIPMVRNNRRGLAVTVSAMLLSMFFKWIPVFAGLNIGVILMLATGISALLGAYLLRKSVTAR